MDGREATRKERFWLAFGLACVPCTAAFLFTFGGVLAGALFTWAGLAALGVVAVMAGAAAGFIIWRRRRACRVPDASR